MTKSLKENASINSSTKISANKVNDQDLAQKFGHISSSATHVYLSNKTNNSTKIKG